MNSRNIVRGCFAILAMFALVTLTSCGGGGSQNKCAGVQCEFGTCDSSSGKCTNRSSCNVESDCIPGYTCGSDGTCTALSECSSDSDCDAGVCKNNACVNPGSCSQNSDCLPRTYCKTSGGDSGKCVADPCNDVTCQRGTCQRGTDKCVSKESCEPDTEIVDCVAGEKCLVTGDSETGTCEGEDDFCNSLECGDNGVCNFNEGGCVDASDCQGDDARCTEGKFCNDQNRCQVDLCQRNETQCDTGVCDPATGQCENADSCESSDGCVASHLCVDGTCKLESSACGDAGGDGGCPGNQICEYDSSSLAATCAEPDVCETSFDCTGERQCGGRVCLEPESCSEDRFEPNNMSGDATVFHEVAEQNSLAASACGGDTDIYKVNTAEIYEAATAGTLLVQLDVDDREQGLGKLNLTVTGPDGNELGTADTGALGAEARAEVSTQLGVPDLGEYTVEVSAADDVKPSGVNYQLSANMVPQPTANVCKDATEIRVNQRVSGTTQGAESTQLASSCSRNNAQDAPEKVYKLNAEAPQEISFRLTPQLSGSDFSLSLRKNCVQPSTEVSCANEAGTGGKEELTALIGSGTYYLVVESSAGGDPGPFELNIDRVFTACSPQDDYCDTEGKAHTCTIDGGRFQDVACNAGCNPSTGFCNPPAGDKCGTANTINPMNTSQRTLSLSQVTNQYEIAGSSGGCLGSGDTQSDGPDQTYKVEIPSQKAFTATVNFDNEVEGSLALVGDCGDASGTCQAGAVDSTDSDFKETLTYSNQSMNAETFYLIVDTAAGQPVSTATLDVSYEDVVCTPGMTQCGTGAIEECNEFGTAYESIAQCGAACNMGACQSDTCGDAVNITSSVQSGGASFTGDWSAFANDYEADDTCGGGPSIDDIDTDGTDHVYQIDMRSGYRLSAGIDGDGQFSLYLKDSNNCGSSGTPCLASDEQEGDPASIEYLAQSQETVYLHADREATSGGKFTVTASSQQAACNPSNYTATCTSSTERQFCTDLGRENTETCLGCNNGSCPTGATCSEAIPIGNGQSDSKKYNGSNDFDPEATGNTGSCTFPEETAGADFVYEVQLQANQTVTADYTGGSSFDVMYMLGTCSDTSSCIDAVDSDGSINYTAGNSAETVYVVMDHESYTNESGSFGFGYTLNITVQ